MEGNSGSDGEGEDEGPPDDDEAGSELEGDFAECDIDIPKPCDGDSADGACEESGDADAIVPLEVAELDGGGSRELGGGAPHKDTTDAAYLAKKIRGPLLDMPAMPVTLVALVSALKNMAPPPLKLFEGDLEAEVMEEAGGVKRKAVEKDPERPDLG